MEMEYLNNNTMLVHLTPEDLSRLGFDSYLDIASDENKVDHFFKKVLEEADVAQRFTDTGALAFQIVPFNEQNGVDLYVTKADGEDAKDNFRQLKDLIFNQQNEMNDEDEDASDIEEGEDEAFNEVFKMELEALKKKQERKWREGPYINNKTFIISFASIEDFIYWAKNFVFTDSEQKNMKIDLYALDDHYEVAFSFSDDYFSEFEVENYYYGSLEYGEAPRHSLAYLKEHGSLLLKNEANRLIFGYFD